MSIVSIIIALLIFSLLVIIHEFGHFIVAKKCGICVTEFSVGMGPRLLSFKKGETRYSLKILPFGGSCQMLGEDEDVDDDRAFGKKSVWKRMAVVFAGPFFNFVLAFVLSIIVIAGVGADPAYVTSCEEGSPAYEAGLREGDVIKRYNGAGISIGRELYLEEYVDPVDGSEITITFERDGQRETISFIPETTYKYMLGMTYYTDDEPAELSDISEGSPLYEAGVESGDIIIAVNGTEISSGSELGEYFNENPVGEDAVSLVLLRGDEEITVSVPPVQTTVYYTGFSYNLSRETQSVGGVIKYSFIEVKYEIRAVIKSLFMLVTGNVSSDEVSGVVGIVDTIGTTYEETIDYGVFYTVMTMLNLSIMLSANLGVINLLPIPALDGGRLVFLIVEAIRRKPVSKEKEGFVHFIGFVLLMILMVFLLYNDIRKLL